MSTVYKHWTDLLKPKQLEVEEKTLTSTYGRFFAEPYERGFGQTVGNSMRRILLSSLMGASIVAVRIKNILHEFSTVPGVTEDVADVILNLKEVRLRLNETEQQTLKIEAKGPGIVYAKDIIAPAAIDILNPETRSRRCRATPSWKWKCWSSSARLRAGGANKEEGAPVDTIRTTHSADSKVNFTVTNVGSVRLRTTDVRSAHRRQRETGRRHGLRRQDIARSGEHLR
jgi:DNA-directed RNA polymerase subunit alpha